MSLEDLEREIREQVGPGESDIEGHLAYFVEVVLRLDAQTVIELGVREGISTRAWLAGLQLTGGRLWSVDTDTSVQTIGAHRQWTLIEGDDLAPATAGKLPDTADVVFIDTSHNYLHTQLELRLYGPRVRPGGVILLHDTDLRIADWNDLVPVIPYPVRKAATEYAEANGWPITLRKGSCGLGVIEVPA